MESIQLHFNYRGAYIDANIYPDELCMGPIFIVELNGVYVLTLSINENQQWIILRENDATIPLIETALFDLLVKKLQQELKYAA